MRRRWILFAILCVLCGAPFAHLMAQQTGEPAAVTSDLAYELGSVGAALDTLERQVAQTQNVPARVTSALARARTEAAALEDAATRGAMRAGLRHYRQATRALGAVSRFLLEREDTENGTPEPREHRLRSRLARLGTRMSEIQQRAQELDLSLDFGAVTARASQIKTLLESGSASQARTELAALRASLDELSDEVDEAQDALEAESAAGGAQ